MTIREHIQAAALGEVVTLYQIDLTVFGLGVFYLTSAPDHDSGLGEVVSYQGQEYAPHPILAEGFELRGGGTLPRPKIAIANIDQSFTAMVEEHDDLHGGIVTRIRTYGRYLDGGADPGGGELPRDVYRISRKLEDDGDQIGWQLSALMDQEGVDLPGRPIIRDYCTHDTRVWNAATETFDYSIATCPYTGEPKDENGLPCAPEDEVFSKRLNTCCQARFGATAVLPTRAFPGVARLRMR